jgi:hypothetical protein
MEMEKRACGAWGRDGGGAWRPAAAAHGISQPSAGCEAESCFANPLHRDQADPCNFLRIAHALSVVPTAPLPRRLAAASQTPARPPIPGDVIIFHPVAGVGNRSIFGDDVFIKRVVAVEGDTVEVGGGGGAWRACGLGRHVCMSAGMLVSTRMPARA